MKRIISLIASLALGLGVLTSLSLPAQAANDNMFCIMADGLALTDARATTGIDGNEACSGVAGPLNQVIIGLSGVAGKKYQIKVSGSGAAITKPAINFTDATLNGGTRSLEDALGVWSEEFALTDQYKTATFLASDSNRDIASFAVNTKETGTITVKIYEFNGVSPNSSATETVVISVNETATDGVVNTSSSIVRLGDTIADVGTLDSDKSITSRAESSTIAAGYIVVLLNDGNTHAVSGKKLTAQTTHGSLRILPVSASQTAIGTSLDSVIEGRAGEVSNQSGTRYSVVENTGGNIFLIGVYPDGTEGVAEITLKEDDKTLATKKVTFVGEPKSIEAEQIRYIVPAGGTLGDAKPEVDNSDITADKDDAAVVVTVKDAHGNGVTGVGNEIIFTSSNSTILSTSGIDSTMKCIENPDKSGEYFCPVKAGSNPAAGTSATITYSIKDDDDKEYKTEPIMYKIGGKEIEKLTVSFTKETYSPGEEMELTISATDADGNPVADGTITLWDDKPETSTTVTGASVEDMNWTFKDGKSTKNFFAPLLSGPFSFTGTTNSGSGAYSPTATKDMDDEDENYDLELNSDLRDTKHTASVTIAGGNTQVSSQVTELQALITSTLATLSKQMKNLRKTVQNLNKRIKNLS